MYAHFDPTTSNTPNAHFIEIDTPRTQDNNEKDNNVNVPAQEITGVHSIKVLRESQLQPSFNEALPSPPSLSIHEPSSPPENQGENLNSILDDDSLREKIEEIKRINKEKAESQYDKIKNEIINLSRIKEKQKWNTNKGYGADVNAQNILKKRRNLKEAKRKATVQVGDQVRIKTMRFGKKYAKGLPEYTQGKVIKIKGKKAGVVYEGGEEVFDTYLNHLQKMLEWTSMKKMGTSWPLCVIKGNGIGNHKPSTPSWLR